MAAGDYGKEPQPQAIPDVRTSKVETVLQALKEWIEVRQGSRGSGLDRAVTFRDLLNSGVAEPGAINGLNMPGLEPIPLITGGGDSSPIPPRPKDLVAAGAVKTIILTWDGGRGYTRHAYFEVWRSETDALGDAVKIAQVYEPMYTDDVGPGAKYYYWVRAASDAGLSPFNAVAGTLGETALDVQEVLDAVNQEINDSGLLEQLTIKIDSNGRVTGYGPSSKPSDTGDVTAFTILADRFQVAGPAVAGVIPSSPFFVQATPATVNGVLVPKGVYMSDAYLMNGVITNAKIGNLAVDDAKISAVNVGKLTAGRLSVGAYIESTNYQSGATGFHINANGNAEFQNATLRGTIYATAGTIGGVRIEAQSVRTTNYNGASAGWAINANGDVHFTNGIFRGTIYATNGTFSGALSAATGTFSGELSAATGTFTGRVHGGYFTTGSYTGYAWPAGSGTGTYLGPSGLLLGNANIGRFFQVEQNGNVYAPGLSIVNGLLTISAANVIDTLQLRGGAVSTTAFLSGSGSALIYSTVPAQVLVVWKGDASPFGEAWVSVPGVAVGSGRFSSVAVNGVQVGRSDLFWYAHEYAPVAAESVVLYRAGTTTAVGFANIPAGYSTISFGSSAGGTMSGMGFALALKR